MKRSNKTFIILSSIFLGVALIAFLFELYLNYGAMRIIYEANHRANDFGEAVGSAVGAALLYVLAVCTGIVSASLSIPVIPFSIIMLRREKNAPYAIAFLVIAIALIVASIAMMFVMPLANQGSAQTSSSLISSSYNQ